MVYSLIHKGNARTPEVAGGGAVPLLGDDARSFGRRVVVAASPDSPLDTIVPAVLTIVV
jgi:hypothetical protein